MRGYVSTRRPRGQRTACDESATAVSNRAPRSQSDAPTTPRARSSPGWTMISRAAPPPTAAIVAVAITKTAANPDPCDHERQTNGSSPARAPAVR